MAALRPTGPLGDDDTTIPALLAWLRRNTAERDGQRWLQFDVDRGDCDDLQRLQGALAEVAARVACGELAADEAWFRHLAILAEAYRLGHAHGDDLGQTKGNATALWLLGFTRDAAPTGLICAN